MNILFFMPTVLIGGVRTVTEILSQGFRERGHNVKWLLLYRIYDDDRDYPDGEDCTYLPLTDVRYKENIDFYNDFVRIHKIDVVINQNGLFSGVELIDSLELKNVIRISVIHNNPELQRQWLWKDALSLRENTIKERFKRIARILLFLRTEYIFEKKLKEHYSKLLSGGSHVNVLSPAYIGVVKTIEPNIVDVSAIANPNTYTTSQIIEKDRTILFVGRLDNRSKNVTEILKIWEKLSKDNIDWRLLIIGDGPDKARLIEQSKGLERIEFLGYKEPRTYYERASIVCMTSIFEGFPMVLTEAMQHGCIPIAYDSFPALHDIINDGEDGIIIKPFERDEFAEKLDTLMHDEVAMRTMSEHARENIRRFDRDVIIDQWEELINRLKDEK